MANDKSEDRQDTPHRQSTLGIVEKLGMIGVLVVGAASSSPEPEALAQPAPTEVATPHDKPVTLTELKKDWAKLTPPAWSEFQSPFVEPSYSAPPANQISSPPLTFSPSNQVVIQASDHPVNIDELAKALKDKGVEMHEDDKGISFSTFLKDLPNLMLGIAALTTAYAKLKKKPEGGQERVTMQVIFQHGKSREP